MSIQGSLTINGVEELSKALKAKVTLNDVKRVVRHNGGKLQNLTTRNANFVKGYQTGTTKRSITLVMSEAGLKATVGPRTEYAPYLEWGTRFMSAQPFVKPSFEAQSQKFVRDLKKLMR